ncbi:methyl-accepting chemotaxis protein [Klebsiella oxytoca]|uniref:methyl-accepting chemotaxis protein n=1 Tax=Klebsiella oxytoca TaxID=571 RepID=UPI00357173F9
MFNRMRVVNCLLFVLGIFAVLQLASGSMFLRTIQADKENFFFNQHLRDLQTQLGTSWMALVQARSTLNRASLGYMSTLHQSELLKEESEVTALTDQAEQKLRLADSAMDKFNATLTGQERNSPYVLALQANYSSYRFGLAELARYVKTGDMSSFTAQQTQKLQDNMEKAFDNWLIDCDKEVVRGTESNIRAYSYANWTLISVFIITAAIIFIVWRGIHSLVIRPLNTSIEHIKHIAKGDLTKTIEIKIQNELGELLTSLKHMQLELNLTVSTVRESSEFVYNSSEEIAAGNNDLSVRTEQQAASLEQTAASMEELTATVKLNAENAHHASSLSQDASGIAEQGKDAVEKIMATMHEIVGSSQKIADITAVIDSIAFQTNILALNAAVEAARAGEQGKGFAVVAGEVRNLAQRCAQAAKDIKCLIEESVHHVEIGSGVVEGAGAKMQQTVDAILHVTTLMGEIASASNEQRRGMEQIGLAVSEMDLVTQQNAALVEESANATVALTVQADHLKQMVSKFKCCNVLYKDEKYNPKPQPV